MPKVATLAPLALALASGLLPGSQSAATAPGNQAVVSMSGRMFTLACSLPFAGAPNPPADDHCGIDGGSSDPGKEAESRAKNNFCSATGSPLLVTHQKLVDMQSASTQASIPRDPADRGLLTRMGEGTYASYVAFVKDAHYSDVGKGENVNCNIPGNSTNDIHIVLVEHLNDDECTSTTAEMTPHFRPVSWTPDSIKAAQDHPVRVSGQLFYDGVHSPCSGKSRPDPQRASLWEILPVYAFDVCRLTDLAQCQATSDPADWVPLDQWVSSEE